MSTPTMNEDEFHGDEGKTPEQVIAEVEQYAAEHAMGDPAVQHEDRPAGYGVLLETYDWRQYPVAPGVAPQVRAYCLTDGQFMVGTLKVDPRYGKTANKTTRGPHAVEYAGRAVQAWGCNTCKQWVTK